MEIVLRLLFTVVFMGAFLSLAAFLGVILLNPIDPFTAWGWQFSQWFTVLGVPALVLFGSLLAKEVA